MALTVTQINAAKPKARPYKLTDGGGLYLLVTHKGSKLWRFDYRYEDRRLTLALGHFPERSLAEAREQRELAKSALRRGVDPGAKRKAKRQKARVKAAAKVEPAKECFEAVARRWYHARKARWCRGYAARIWGRIADDIVPHFGTKPAEDVSPQDVLKALRLIEARGSVETARRVRTYVENIFKFAKAEGLVRINSAEGLVDALATPPPTKHRAALKARDLPEFLRDLAAYDGGEQTRLALEFTVLTFVRTGEVRFAEWSEFEDLYGPEPLWRIPAHRMKMRNEHLVPLAPQVVRLLGRIKRLSCGSDYLFPGGGARGVISENTLIYGLYRMGYHSRATVHGFRGTASTILNEKGFNRDWIERQLAHADPDEVRAAYNSAQWLADRRRMMIWWASHIDRLRMAPVNDGGGSLRPANDDGYTAIRL